MVTTNNNKFININNKDDEMVSYFLGIDIGVKMTSRKIMSRINLSFLVYQA